LKLSEDRKRYELIPERVATIRLIFELSCAGKGCNAIADELQGRGIKTVEGKSRWHPNFIIRMLQDRACLGEFQPQMRATRTRSVNVGEPIPDYFPAIIDQRTFDRANTLVSSRNLRKTRGPSKPHRTNIFKDILFDPENKPFHIHITYPREYRMLRSKYGAGGPTISYEMMERAFVLCISEIDATSLRDKADDETTGLIDKLASIDAKIAMIKARIKTEDDIGYLLDSQRDLTRDREAAKKALEDAMVRCRNPIVESVKALQESPVSDAEYFRARLRLAVTKIYLAVDELPLAGRKWKIGHCQIHFRGGYTKAYTFGYRNSRGYLAEEVKVSDVLNVKGHNLGPWRSVLGDQRKQVFLSVTLESALRAHIVGAKVPSEEEMATWQAAADRGDLVSIE
jgi:hypothetical protein